MAVSKRNQLVGLDIGSHSIKLVEIDHRKKGRVLKSFGIAGLPKGTIVEGSIKDMGVVSSSIRDLFRNLKVKNKNVAISVSGFSVIVKKIPMSRQDESELEKKIKDEAEQFIPFDIDDVNLDYEIVEAEEEGGEEREEADQMQVMLVAAKREVVEDYEMLVKDAGLNPIILDVDALTLQNAFEVNADEPNGNYALVNIGAQELGINAIKDGTSMFTRDSSYGGLQLTEAIMSEFNVEFEEAEKIKLGGTRVEEKEGALEEIFQSVVSGWVQEIKRALDFLASTYPNEAIEKIYVSGGSCRVPGFQKYLEMETETPVAEFNPFSSLIINERVFDSTYLRYMAPQAAVAVGLGLRSMGDK